jgi:hypothetical protein
MKSFLSWSAWMAFVLGAGSVGWSEGKESAHWKSFQSSTDRSPAEILTDYSYAGYEHGEKGIPDVQGPIFKVTDYGAKADDAISDEDPIRKAVAAAEQAGGGVVLFPPGKFLIWTDRKKVEPISDYVWLLMHAMSLCPPFVERVVFRGVKDLSPDAYKEGDIITWCQFSSTAATVKVQNTFLGQTGVRTLFTIELTTDRAREIHVSRPRRVGPTRQ